MTRWRQRRRSADHRAVARYHARRGGSGLRDPIVRRLLSVVIGGLAGLAMLPVLGDITLGLARPITHADGACRVVRVIDGDTVDFLCSGVDSGLIRTRLTGYDAPELFSPACNTELTAALAAKWYLRAAIWDAGALSVRFAGVDRYDRRLAEVSLDGEPLSRRMIAAGHGRAYDGGRRGGWCG